MVYTPCFNVPKNGSIGFNMHMENICKTNEFPMHRYSLYGSHEPQQQFAKFKFNGVIFSVFMCNLDGIVSVTLIPDSPPPSMEMSHAVHIVGRGRRLEGVWHKIKYIGAGDVDGDDSKEESNGSAIHKRGDKLSARFDKNGCRVDVIAWDDLQTIYTEDGVFDIEFNFAPSPVLPLYRIPMDKVWSDFTIKLASDSTFALPCNRGIVMLGSKVFDKILRNDTSKKTLTIGAEFATTDVVQLFVECMHTGWHANMDEHAGVLLRLANAYACPEIAMAAVHSIERQLNDKTFWAIARLAFLLDEGQPALVHTIVDYILMKPARKMELFGRTDNQTPDEVSRLAHEIDMAQKPPTTTEKSESKKTNKSKSKSAGHLVNKTATESKGDESIKYVTTEEAAEESEEQCSTEYEDDN